MEKYKIIKSKYLADGLSFCNFKYQKYTNDEGKTVYSFINSEKLESAIKTFLEIKHDNM